MRLCPPTACALPSERGHRHAPIGSSWTKEGRRRRYDFRRITGRAYQVRSPQQLEHRVADQVGEIERMSRLRRFLPPQVADLIVASGSEKQLESHRREIIALFCDLRGFTGFSEIADPEDVIALLRDYHVAIGELVIKYGGTLERYAGDGVMVIFNDPVPVESPALQAVLMALEVREALSAFDGNLEPPRARDWLWDRHCAWLRHVGDYWSCWPLRLCRYRDSVERRFSALRRGETGSNPH